MDIPIRCSLLTLTLASFAFAAPRLSTNGVATYLGGGAAFQKPVQ